MSKKVAELSAGLVAVKGAAAPAADMPSRAAAAAPPSVVEAGKGRGEALLPLNFRVGAAFRRDFKTYAALHDMKLNELLRRSFAALREQQGD